MSLFLQSTTLRVRLHKQLSAVTRPPQFGVRVTRIRPRNLRRYSWDLQLHVGINRLVLWTRNAQLLCHPHQFRQRSEFLARTGKKLGHGTQVGVKANRLRVNQLLDRAARIVGEVLLCQFYDFSFGQ
jgi:hypothetical protein